MQSVELKDLITYAPAEQKDEAERIFEKVFESLKWTHVIQGKVVDISAMTRWKHREPADVESDLAYLEINRSELQSALSDYLSNPLLTSKQADWLFLNALTYAEYLAAVSEIRKKVMGVERYVKSLLHPKTEHIIDISAFTKRPWHLAVTLMMIAISWTIHPLVGTVAIGAALYAKYRKKRATEQVNSTLESMYKTYLAFNTADLSWAQVTATLERSCEAGAIWDASLYALAEQRMQAPTAKSLHASSAQRAEKYTEQRP